MVRKEFILDEIRRTALANGGTPLGRQAFLRETGIREFDWSGKFWARWNDAVREAGFVPNQLQSAIESNALLAKYADLARESGRLPGDRDLRLRRRSDPSFPSHTTFRRFGHKPDSLQAVASYCEGRPGYEAVIKACREQSRPEQNSASATKDAADGFVYMTRVRGRFYKIGKTNAAGRRERELAIQLPEKATTVHVTRTDDPAGIEAYWHQRFASKRRNGEWFELEASDVATFKRRKFQEPRWTPENRPVRDRAKPASGKPPLARVL